ncbi:hypothetical protein CRG98_008772 [Punica granatum]|uniref:Uncharacterized protein n=1 Tax=Punica granatum TaxID=22663 RepID=A0A2I0KQZ0_PUNGR|nr:hypothetical protein CRG98_008772 [Punica granatum]
MEEEQQPVVFEHKTLPMPPHSLPQGAHVIPLPVASTAYSGAPSTHLLPPAQALSNAIDPVRFTALEGMVNQLAANMNTNMAELMAMLRDQNRASLSYTPLPKRRTMVDPNPVVPPIYVTDKAGKKLDIGIKLGRIEALSRKKEGETSKRQTSGSSKKSKDATVGTVNSQRRASQLISVDYTPTPQILQAYVHPVHYTQAYPLASPTVIQPPPPQQYVSTQAQQNRVLASRSPHPAQRTPAPRAQQGSAAQSRPRKQYTTLLAPPYHIFRQLISSNKIRTEAPGPHFDPTVQNQNLRCEFHQGALGHTLDTCWRLRDKIQEMIDTRQISFNEVKPPNVCANPLPDHGSGSGPSVNMISIVAI